MTTTSLLRRSTALAAALSAAALAGAPGAWAAPAAPPDLRASTPSPSQATTASFFWSPAAPADSVNRVRYEGGINGTVVSFGEATSAGPFDLPEGTTEFRVRGVEVDAFSGAEDPGPFATITVVSDRSAPAISGTASPGVNRFGWSTRPVTVAFTCVDPHTAVTACTAPTVVGEGRAQAVTGTARNAVGLESTAAVRDINVDPTPPASAVPAAPGAGAIVRERRPTLDWTAATDATSGVVGYQIFIDNPRGSGSPNFVRGTTYTPPGDLAIGRHTWFVRSIDFARNTTDSELREFVIDPSSSPGPAPTTPGGGATGGGDTPSSGGGSASGGSAGSGGSPGPGSAPAPEETTTGGGRTVLRPPTQNARELTPRAGLRLRTTRPVLRWSTPPRGTTLSNVQVFRMRGRSLTKVHSAFPRGRSHRLPAGLLKPGETYVWRVWPFRGRRGFTARPLGVSWFRLGTVEQLLPAAARARITAPRSPLAARGEGLVVSWRARPGIRRYKVTLERAGEPVYSALAIGPRIALPGRALRRAGTYAVIVRAGRKGSFRRFTPAPWAATAIRVR